MLQPAIESPTRRYALARLLREAWREYERDHARYFAAAMVYYALASLVPLLLLFLAVLGLLLRFADFAAAADQQVLRTIETSFGAELRVTIEKLLGRLEQESLVATLVSLVGLALTASALFRHLRLTFRAIWKYSPPLVAGPVRVAIRAAVVEYAMAYVMVLTGGLLLILALSLVSVMPGNLRPIGRPGTRLAVPDLGARCAVDLIHEGRPERLVTAGPTDRGDSWPELHPATLAGHSSIYTAGSRSHMAVLLTCRNAIVGAMTFVAHADRQYTKEDLDLIEELGRRAALSIDNARLYEGAREALGRSRGRRNFRLRIAARRWSPIW